MCLERTNHDRGSGKATSTHRVSAKVCTSPSSVLPVTYRWKCRIPKDVAKISIILSLMKIVTVSTVDSECPVRVKRGSKNLQTRLQKLRHQSMLQGTLQLAACLSNRRKSTSRNWWKIYWKIFGSFPWKFANIVLWITSLSLSCACVCACV